MSCSFTDPEFGYDNLMHRYELRQDPPEPRISKPLTNEELMRYQQQVNQIYTNSVCQGRLQRSAQKAEVKASNYMLHDPYVPIPTCESKTTLEPKSLDPLATAKGRSELSALSHAIEIQQDTLDGTLFEEDRVVLEERQKELIKLWHDKQNKKEIAKVKVEEEKPKKECPQLTAPLPKTVSDAWKKYYIPITIIIILALILFLFITRNRGGWLRNYRLSWTDRIKHLFD